MTRVQVFMTRGSVLTRALLRNKSKFQARPVIRNESSLAGPTKPDNVICSPFGDVVYSGQPLTDFIFEKHEEYAQLPAITDGSSGRSYSYGTCNAMVHKCAQAYLSAMKLQPGDMIGLILPNIPEFVIVINGALKAGLQVTFANPLYTEDELTRQFLDSKVKAIVTIDLFMDKVQNIKKILNDYKGSVWIGGESNESEGIFGLKSLLAADYGKVELPKIDVDSIAIVPYSSGTTGLPKGVMLTHKNLVVNLQQLYCEDFRRVKRIGDNRENILTVPPFFHIYGFNGILNYNMSIGNHIISIPKFTPEEYLKCLLKYKPTYLFVVPSLLTFLASHPMVNKDHLASVREIMIGAAPCTENMIEKFLNKCEKSKDELTMQIGYGMTESAPVITLTPYGYPKSKLCSIGQLAPGTEAKIVSLSTGKSQGPHSAGELLIKGPQVMKGYLNNKAATEETVDQEGWLHTGDVAYYDEDHYLYIVDRTKELIKVKGNQVSPTELENILLEIPGVADAAVVGVPDTLAGELPRAFVVLKPGADVTEISLAEWVAGKVVKYKRLEGGVFIIDSIPRNPGGKIMRNQLKVLGEKAARC